MIELPNYVHDTNAIAQPQGKCKPKNLVVTACLQLATCEPIKEIINVSNYQQLFKVCKYICLTAGVPKPFKRHKMCIVYESSSKEKNQIIDYASL